MFIKDFKLFLNYCGINNKLNKLQTKSNKNCLNRKVKDLNVSANLIEMIASILFDLLYCVEAKLDDLVK